MRETLQERDVVGPMPKAARRHHRPLVPVEQIRERVERLVVAETGLQLLEGVGQDAWSLAMRGWRTGLEPATTGTTTRGSTN